MYINEFYFSPFEIKNNNVSIWSGLLIVEEGKIYYEGKEITPSEFYDLFLKRAAGTWFVEDFVKAFPQKQLDAEAIAEFAVYCQFVSQSGLWTHRQRKAC